MGVVIMRRVDHQRRTAESLQKGMRAHGDECDIYDSSEELRMSGVDYDAVCAWGWRRCEPLFRNGHSAVLVMERAYLLDRFHWVSLGWNGLNGKAQWPLPTGTRRWNEYFAQGMRPWIERDLVTDREQRYALVLGQVPTDTACRHIHFQSWAGFVTHQLHLKGWTVVFRPHPQALTVRVLTSAIISKDRSLYEDLDGAAFAVTFNSNAGVDAVMYGVPTVTIDQGAMAWDVASHSLDDPLVMPDRTQWGTALAWKQWLPKEITDGTAWAAVRSAMPRR